MWYIYGGVGIYIGLCSLDVIKLKPYNRFPRICYFQHSICVSFCPSSSSQLLLALMALRRLSSITQPSAKCHANEYCHKPPLNNMGMDFFPMGSRIIRLRMV